MVKIERRKAPSTRIQIFFNPQLFLCGFGFPATTRIGWIWKTNPQLFESALQSGNFLIRYESGIVWMLNPDSFVSGRDVTKSSPVLYTEYCIQDGNFVPRFSLLPAFTTHALLPIEWIRPTCQIRGRANSIWVRIRVDVEIFESGKKKFWIQKISGYVWKGPKSSTLGVEYMGNL